MHCKRPADLTEQLFLTENDPINYYISKKTKN